MTDEQAKAKQAEEAKAAAEAKAKQAEADAAKQAEEDKAEKAEAERQARNVQPHAQQPAKVPEPAKTTAKDRLAKLVKAIPSDTPDDYNLYGYANMRFTLADAKELAGVK